MTERFTPGPYDTSSGRTGPIFLQIFRTHQLEFYGQMGPTRLEILGAHREISRSPGGPRRPWIQMWKLELVNEETAVLFRALLL